MDYTLNNCLKQAELISSIFFPQVNAMTHFVNKVFEDCISEYMTAILVAAKSRENLAIYLHTLATSTYSCTQFIELIEKNHFNVYVDIELIKSAMKDLLKPYAEGYIDQEMDLLSKRLKAEIEKWNNRKQPHDKLKKRNSEYLKDAQKAQEHKRLVMDAMKAIMFAPVTLTKTIVQLGGGTKLSPHKQSLLTDAEPIQSEPENDNDDTVTYHLDDNSMNSLVSLELALHLMHSNKETLGRVLVVTAFTDMTKM